MGLHLCYELSAVSGESEAGVLERVTRLRTHALTLPFGAVSTVVRLTERELAGPSPMRGLAFERLEDVVHVAALWARRELYRRQLGLTEEDVSRVEAPAGLPAIAVGFAVAPGKGSEPASFGLATLRAADRSADWWWHQCCKTQYASVQGDEHLLRCHGSLVALLDAARELGLGVVVRDETGYWDSRDARELATRVREMNRIVARLAGAFTDHVRGAGGDSRQVQGAVFDHPDFERLESEE